MEDKEYIKLIKENYPIITNKYSDLEDKRLKWERIKMEIRALTIPYSKNKQKNLRIKEQDLRNRLDKLDNLLSQSANVDDANEKHQEFARLKQELHLLYENKGKGSILRSKTRWIEQGKKTAKYFFNLEKWNYNRKVIKELKRSDGGILF